MANRQHYVIFSRSCFECSPLYYESLVANITQLKAEGFHLYCTSHDPEQEDIIKETGLEGKLEFLPRDEQLRPQIKTWSNDGSVVIIVGVVNEDLYVAASTKSFLIGADWVLQEEKVIKYGVQAPTPNKMKAILNIITNQAGWFYKCSFTDRNIPTKIVALCSGNTYSCSIPPDEKDVAERFEAILKSGNQNPTVKQALMCHLMAAIAHDPDFKEVQDWAVVPSSSVGPNEVMDELKEHVRYMMNGRKPAAIFKRHTAVTKSRFDTQDARQRRDYCLKHFRSIKVNEEYKGKLKGRVVCLLDDYLTHGNMFETLRNILVTCGVKKIICVSIGKFLRWDETDYKQKQFKITGDVYQSESYDAVFQSVTSHATQINQTARRSVADLKPLIQSLSQG